MKRSWVGLVKNELEEWEYDMVSVLNSMVKTALVKKVWFEEEGKAF